MTRTPVAREGHIELVPLRLSPGVDLRRSLEEVVAKHGAVSAFVVSGIGSLTGATLRYANEATNATLPGPLEILGLAGSLSADGAHLHMSVSDACGVVRGGHVAYGNVVRTTAEVLLALLPDWSLTRAWDPASGFEELVVRRRVE